MTNLPVDQHAAATTAVAAADVEVKADGEIDVIEETAAPNPGSDEPLGASERDPTTTKDEITDWSDLSQLDRRIWVVTTAAMPWRTGTAVNPLMRALYLTRGRAKHSITLLVPWLEDVASRKKLYGDQLTFEEGGKQAQEEWIRDFCRTRANCAEEEGNLRILFWEGVYVESFGSIFPTADICRLIPSEEADIAILEEPEHLNWFLHASPSSSSTEDIITEPCWGWNQKFKHVVGILHTNYGSYLRQYGMGASLFTAPALNALSSLVVRAYCKRIIRLSATLPCFDVRKEVTSNVHGVRSEFLDPPQPRHPTTSLDEEAEVPFAPVYFIGKLIWAKGFETMLEAQEKFLALTGKYFDIDIYGAGNDEKAIKLSCFGRTGLPRGSSSLSASDQPNGEETETSVEDRAAAEVFGKPTSLRGEIDAHDGTLEEGEPTDHDVNPLEVFSDLSGKTVTTGVETADAALKLIESVMRSGLDALRRTRGEVRDAAAGKDPKWNQRAFNLGPARARFKWRRDAIPARFLGVQDHIVVRDIPEHKCFLNCSTTEVLCTTTAEALAMGKFVVIPKHPSNEFFMDFPNCLAYDTIDDCVLKIQYALENEPEPLTEKYIHMLSWEGATDRLFVSSAITKEEEAARLEANMDEEELKAARFHVEAAKKSLYVTKLFGGGKARRPSN